MKRYWQFAIVGVICLLVALLWAQPPRSQAQAAVVPAAQRSTVPKPNQGRDQASQSPTGPRRSADPDDNDAALPGSNTSLPLLAVIGFGVLAGGITSAMRTR